LLNLNCIPLGKQGILKTTLEMANQLRRVVILILALLVNSNKQR
jgi:hypothetical protein